MNREIKKYDVVIIGAGIIGMSITREISKAYPQDKIAIIEKEEHVAYHASGRNSGVLHTGFYYTADTLKAKFTRDGNKEMTEYCINNNLRINKCGKVVVAQDEDELKTLFDLYDRGICNNVNVKLIDENELAMLDANVKTFKNALYSPDTSTVDPVEVCQCIERELIALGIDFFYNNGYKKKLTNESFLTTQNNIFKAKKIINCAGLYADKIAKDYGFSNKFTIIPFKGIYLKSKDTNKEIKVNVYPVPNLKNPFLGVHFTITVDGTIKIGPTAIPAFWRENYQFLSRFNIFEFFQILFYESKLFIFNSFNFRALAYEEMKKYNKSYFISLSRKMLHNMKTLSYQDWSRPGIRAQLLNTQTLELVQDFVVEGDESSVHILNAVSPAFTCSFPFSR